MNFLKFLINEFRSFSLFERVVFPFSIAAVFFVSYLSDGTKIALISSICGITYTILAGKGRFYCYFIGLSGTGLYAYLAFLNSFFGNFALNIFYYFPMQILGIFKWRAHLKKGSAEIIKTSLSKKEKAAYFFISSFASVVLGFILHLTGDITPFKDAVATVFSIAGQLLAVKRCIEQWYFWFAVNFVSLLMWYQAYQEGSKTAVYLFMWSLYLVLSVYFYFVWKKELTQK